MKHSMTFLCLGLFLLGLQPNAQSQDRFYSQIFANRLQLSPALAGSETYYGFGVMSQARWQWIGLDNFVHQYGGAYHSSFLKNKNGFGAFGISYGINYQIERTNDGSFQQTKVDFHLAKRFEVRPNRRRHRFSIGIAGGLQSQLLDSARVQLPTRISKGQIIAGPQIDSIGETYSPDFQVGLSYSYQNIFAVTTVKHLQKIVFANRVNPISAPFYSVTMGIRLRMGDSILNRNWHSSLTPFVHYQLQASSDQWILGANLNIENLTLSARYALKNHWSGGIAYRYGPLRLAYQYDYFLGDYDFELWGSSHEISLKCVLDTGPTHRIQWTKMLALPKF